MKEFDGNKSTQKNQDNCRCPSSYCGPNVADMKRNMNSGVTDSFHCSSFNRSSPKGRNQYICCHHRRLDCYNIHNKHNSSSTYFWRSSFSSSFIKPWLTLSFILTFILLHTTDCVRASAALDRYAPNLEVYDHRLALDDDGAFVVEWTPVQDKVIFRVTVRTRGYIGFGLSSTGRMDGADIVVGWVHSGKAYLQDRHGKGNTDPMVDEQQDWMLVWGFENDTHTVLIMNRPYNTCDPKDHVISNDTVRLLWAYHPDDPVDPESPRPRLHYHAFRRGTRSAFLLQRPQHPHMDYVQRLPIYNWTMTNPGIHVETKTGSDDTLYWCKIFKRPRLIQKNHIIRYEPVFSGGSEAHVHHMIVYECTNQPTLEQALEELSQMDGHPCYQANMSKLMLTCNHVVVVWAVGSGGLSLPPEAGYPLTPNGPRFYMMETHYDLPELTEVTFKDYSGIRALYTPVLRNYDAGVLSVGLDPNWKHLIPPRQATVISQGHCVPECTELALPTTGINVFAAVLHTHLLGRKVRVRHIRQGRELEPVAQDNNYDFNYQEYRALKKSRLVLPGDHLISECEYNSMERSTITLGGFKTRDEMCLSFLFYWPRVDLSFCHSKPSLSTVLQSLGIHELSHDSNPIKIKRPIELAGKTLEWRLQNYDWENHFQHFQKATKDGSFNQMCWKRGTSIIPALEKLDYEQPNITNPWSSNDFCPKKKNIRRRKNKGRPRGGNSGSTNSAEDIYRQQHHHRQHHLLQPQSDNADEGDFFEDDVMFDDVSNFKPIERIDVDPVQSFDVFLPVIKPNLEPINTLINVHPESFDTSDSVDERRLQGEFVEMERELEKEVNRLPDNFSERTAHHNTDKEINSSGNSPLISRTLWGVYSLVVVLLLLQRCK